MAAANLTAERVRAILHYNPETGILTWLVHANNNGAVAGTVAGAKRRGRPYVTLGIDGRRYYAHRVAWLHFYGQWPSHSIDHMDGDPSNNRIANLRDVRHVVNMQNRNGRVVPSNCTGYTGVQPNGKTGFMANIHADGKLHYLGTFRTVEQAAEAYRQARGRLHAPVTRASPAGTIQSVAK